MRWLPESVSTIPDICPTSSAKVASSNGFCMAPRPNDPRSPPALNDPAQANGGISKRVVWGGAGGASSGLGEKVHTWLELDSWRVHEMIEVEHGSLQFRLSYTIVHPPHTHHISLNISLEAVL